MAYEVLVHSSVIGLLSNHIVLAQKQLEFPS